MDKLFLIYKRLLEIHIQSFTTGTQYHKDTEKAYEIAFDVFHTISEMRQALKLDDTTDCCDSGQEAYDLIEEMKSIVAGIVKSNKDLGMDDLLRGLAKDTTFLCGIFTQYTQEAEKEEETDQEEVLNPLTK